MLINLSNHPYSEWSAPQRSAAEKYGECRDIPFPHISPKADEDTILELANKYLLEILDMKRELNEPIVVHLMGEQTFCFALLSELISCKIPCVASCSARNVEILEDGTKLVHFNFQRFREYRK